MIKDRAVTHRRNRAVAVVAATVTAAVALGVAATMTTGGDTTDSPVRPATEPTSDAATVPWSDRTDFEEWRAPDPTDREPTTPCGADDLRYMRTESEGATQSIHLWIEFEKVTPGSCTLEGHPGLTGVGTDGERVAIGVSEQAGASGRSPGGTVTLMQGERSNMTVVTGASCTAGTSFPYTYSDLAVVLPRGGEVRIGDNIESACVPDVTRFEQPRLDESTTVRWQGLSVTVSAPETVTAGAMLEYVVTLTNNGEHDIGLAPCGGYRQALVPTGKVEWHGTAREYRLNCDSAPILAPGSSRTYEMVLEVPDRAPSMDRARLSWDLLDDKEWHDAAHVEIAITGGIAPASPAPVTETPGSERPEPADRELAAAFVAFAEAPSPQTATDIPFADIVEIGLGPTLFTSLKEEQRTDETAWTLYPASHSGYTGPFNALAQLRRIGTDISAYDVSVGAHNHCASPPQPAPPGFDGHRRVSMQPAEGTYSSCLAWMTVDLFLDADGRIAAATLEVYEP